MTSMRTDLTAASSEGDTLQLLTSAQHLLLSAQRLPPTSDTMYKDVQKPKFIDGQARSMQRPDHFNKNAGAALENPENPVAAHTAQDGSP
ncbi:hypothetical protein TRAPUB_8316 [Trametes pubescens]|uniref:Uncharacterized protein n=1 Tax=Trametes pubescens TaxID=154538 RepID=A0A1M2W5I6_TRAPU|nr:hypothetical protein TRAPUB_8316 [Trametes pubescens]